MGWKSGESGPRRSDEHQREAEALLPFTCSFNAGARVGVGAGQVILAAAKRMGAHQCDSQLRITPCSIDLHRFLSDRSSPCSSLVSWLQTAKSSISTTT
jgi:hypothetical protein